MQQNNLKGILTVIFDGDISQHFAKYYLILPVGSVLEQKPLLIEANWSAWIRFYSPKSEPKLSA